MSDDTADDSDVTLEEAISFARSMAEDESESFNGDVPQHAPGLLAARGTDLLQTVTNIEMAKASERTEDPTEEQIASVVEDDAVDILLALGALAYEYDIDIVGAFEERIELVEDYRAFQEAMENVETEDEAIEVVDEHMTEELAEIVGTPMDGGRAALDGATPIEPGDNVDGDEYEHDEKNKSFA